MKKVFATLLALVLLLSLTACGKPKKTQNLNNEKPGTAIQPTNTATQPIGSTIQPTGTVTQTPEPPLDVKTIYVLTTQKEYDENGQNTKTYTSEYDAFAQLLSFSSGSKRTDINMKFSYDEYGNCTKWENHGAPSYWFDWKYDNDQPEEYYKQYSEQHGDSFCLEYKDGLLVGVYLKDSNGKAIWVQQHVYDQQGRLVRESYFGRSAIDSCEHRTYQYEDDWLVRVEMFTTQGTLEDYNGDWDGDYTTFRAMNFAYNHSGQLVEASQYNYDGDKNEEWIFSYNNLGHPANMEYKRYQDSTITTETEIYECDEYGNIVKITYDDGTWTEYTYEKMTVTTQQAAAYRIRCVVSFQLNNPVLWSMSYGDDLYILIYPPQYELPYLYLLD